MANLTEQINDSRHSNQQLEGEFHIYGEMVLDKLLGVQRASVARIYFRGFPLSADLESTLKKLKTMDHQLNDKAPHIVTTLDPIVLSPAGELRNLHGGRVLLPKPVTAIDYELSARDVIWLWHLHTLYPEIEWEEHLFERMQASMKHFVMLAPKISDLKLLLMEFNLQSL